MFDTLFEWLFGPEKVGPYVSAAGLSWRLVSRRFERKLNAALAKGYKKGQYDVLVEHGYWPINRLRLSVWLEEKDGDK